jgi:hypothetical protein
LRKKIPKIYEEEKKSAKPHHQNEMSTPQGESAGMTPKGPLTFEEQIKLEE